MRKNIFLYLALACFIGLIALFVVDGYLGIYDTIYLTAGEREERIEPDFWLRQGSPAPDGTKAAFYLPVNSGDKVRFRYQIENHQFSRYSADTEVSAWHSQQKVRDLLTQQISVAAFDKGSVEWGIDTAELRPSGMPLEQSYEFTVIIKRGDIERRVILYVNPPIYPPKTVPVPSR